MAYKIALAGNPNCGKTTPVSYTHLDVYIEEDGSVQINGDEIPTVYDVEPDHNHKSAEIKAFPKRCV